MFSTSQLDTMAKETEWRNKLVLAAEKKEETKWELHATGDADMNGRKYVALPKGTKLTDEVKRRYNLM